MRTLSWAGAVALLAALAAPATADDDLPSLSIYGFLRADALISDAPLLDLRAPIAAAPRAPDAEADGSFALHARLSRVGLQVDQWRVGGNVTGEGQVEVDFFGGDHGVRLRHAWAAIHTSRKTEVLIGQTWDLLSPLYPLASPATNLWFAGNTGGFRPQVRVTHMPSDRVRIAVAIAGHGAVDGTTGADLDGDGAVDGEDGARPMGQWLVEARGEKGGRLGVWGHLAREAIDGGHVTSYSIGGHFHLPIGKGSAMLGEITHGRDLTAIGGGTGRGIDLARRRGVRSTSGWLELTTSLSRRVLFGAGTALDFARAADLQVGDRRGNIVSYALLRYRPRDTVELGVEGNYWISRYLGADDDDDVDGRALRADFHAAVLF